MKNPPDVKRTFAIDIGQTHDGLIAVVKSLTEGKVLVIKAPNMRLMMAEIGKVVRRRQSRLIRFPVSKPSGIITVEENMTNPARLILPSNGQ